MTGPFRLGVFLAVVASLLVGGSTAVQAAPMIADFTASPLVVNNDALDFGPAGSENIAAKLETDAVNFGDVLYVSDTDGNPYSGNFFSGTTGNVLDQNGVDTGAPATGGIPSADDEEMYFVYTTYNYAGGGTQDSLFFGTRSAVGGQPTYNAIAVDYIDAAGLGMPTVFGLGDTIGHANNFTQTVTSISATPYSNLSNASIFVPIEGGDTNTAPDDPTGDDRFVDNNGGGTMGALGFAIERAGQYYFGYVVINDLPGRNTLEILGYGIESDPDVDITVDLPGLSGCIIGDVNCDGYIDIGNDILIGFTNFTGPGSFGKTRAEGDVEGPSAATTNAFGHDGDVDVSDLLTMFSAFTGPAPDEGGLAAAEAGGPGTPDLIYDSATGEVVLDTDGAGIIGYVLKNGDNTFLSGNHTPILGGVSTSLPGELSEAAFASASGSIGMVFPTGMDLAALTAYLTTNEVSPSLGAPVVPFDLVVLNAGPAVPEPAAVMLSVIGLVGFGLIAYRRRRC